MGEQPSTAATQPTEPSGVHLVHSEDTLTARLLGEADLVTAPVLRQILTGAVNAAAEPQGRSRKALRLVLDLSDLSFCDVRCLVVLSDTLVEGRSAGVSVSVTGASGTIERVWALLGCQPPLASCQGPVLPSADPWQEPAAAAGRPPTGRRGGRGRRSYSLPRAHRPG